MKKKKAKTKVKKVKKPIKAKEVKKKVKRKRATFVGKEVKVRKRKSSVFSPEQVERLTERGKKRGFITFSEILYFFPSIEKDIKGLEILLENLESRPK